MIQRSDSVAEMSASLMTASSGRTIGGTALESGAPLGTDPAAIATDTSPTMSIASTATATSNSGSCFMAPDTSPFSILFANPPCLVRF